MGSRPLHTVMLSFWLATQYGHSKTYDAMEWKDAHIMMSICVTNNLGLRWQQNTKIMLKQRETRYSVVFKRMSGNRLAFWATGKYLSTEAISCVVPTQFHTSVIRSICEAYKYIVTAYIPYTLVVLMQCMGSRPKGQRLNVWTIKCHRVHRLFAWCMRVQRLLHTEYNMYDSIVGRRFPLRKQTARRGMGARPIRLSRNERRWLVRNVAGALRQNSPWERCIGESVTKVFVLQFV